MKTPAQPPRKPAAEKRQPPRRNIGKTSENSTRPRLVDEIADIDKVILKLLLKRYNLLEKLRRNGQIPKEDEKILREAWQREATRISRDTQLTSKFFPVLQSLSFLPRPAPGKEENPGQPDARDAFSLNPPRLPVKINLAAPLSSRLTRIWLYMACVLGQPLSLHYLLMNSSLTNFIRIMEKLGARFNFDVDNIAVIPGMPIASPDAVIHAGDNPFNFYLVLAHYAIRPTRAKLMGEISLEPDIFSSLTAFLVSLGCRLTPTVPKTMGLPCRIECSSILPTAINFPADLPEEFALALAIACLFYDKPIALDFTRLPGGSDLLSGLIPLLNQAGATYKLDNLTLNFAPAQICLPDRPAVPFAASAASFLLSLPMPLKGECRLTGNWPAWSKSERLRDLLIRAGMPWRSGENLVTCESQAATWNFHIPLDAAKSLSSLPAWAQPLLCALAACACLAGGSSSIPAAYLEDPHTHDFLTAAGLESDGQGKLAIASGNAPVWNAPDPAWAMALALAACAGKGRKPLRLGNPGIVSGLWSYFWQIYNSLPVPAAPAAKAPPPTNPKRRRIHTNAIATLPELKEED